jgi:3-phosphoshikimate 1-carboxyvinyltransferase
MRRIIDPLKAMGVAIEGTDGCAPLKIGVSSRPLHAGAHVLPVASAQVKSCLLLAALAADDETTILEPGPSRDHTERMLQAMGVQVLRGVQQPVSSPAAFWTRLQPPSPLVLSPLDATLPGDMSAAAFLIVAALITPGSEIRLEGVGLNPTRTGLLDALLEMGAEIQIDIRPEQGGEPVGDLTVRHSRLHGIQVSGERVVRMIDEFPAFSAAAAWAEGETLVRDAQELRNKESDRIDVLGEQLRQLGIDFHPTADGFLMHGGDAPAGGEVAASGDHRLAMSLALVGLSSRQPVTVHGAEIIHESFPGFAKVLRSLGADIHLFTGSGEVELE